LLCALLVAVAAIWGAFFHSLSNRVGNKHWDREYAELCAYDPMCVRLTFPNGVWKEPREDLIEILRQLAGTINRTATLYHVPPKAIISVILAEDAMNSNFVDRLEDFLVTKGILAEGKLLSRSFSVGPGQVNVETAAFVEPYSAKIEKRQLRSRREVAKKAVEIGGSISYVAAILRFGADKYAEYGFPIDSSPALLVTVYNLGDWDNRLKAKKPGAPVRENYFGYFYRRYVDKLRWPVDAT
jgi:hypothetical protein